MDTIETIRTRRVTRSFTDRQVELAQLLLVVDAGRHAMSARNLQPWQFILIRDRTVLREVGALCTTGPFVAEAPAAIVVLKDRSSKRWADVDCAQAVQNMANAAWSLGLGTCWVGTLEQDRIRAILGIPETWAIFTILPLGYPAARSASVGQGLKPRSETVHFERYGQHEP